jgi:hypothetical protein
MYKIIQIKIIGHTKYEELKNQFEKFKLVF